MNLTELLSDLPKKAKRLTSERAVVLWNTYLFPDIKELLMAAEPDYFKNYEQLVTITLPTTSYALDGGMGEVRMVERIDTEARVNIKDFRTIKESKDDDSVEIKLGNLNVTSSTNLDTVQLLVTGYRNIPFITDPTAELPIDTFLQDRYKQILTTGLAYFYFVDRNRQSEMATLSVLYNDAKSNIIKYELL